MSFLNKLARARLTALVAGFALGVVATVTVAETLKDYALDFRCRLVVEGPRAGVTAVPDPSVAVRPYGNADTAVLVEPTYAGY